MGFVILISETRVWYFLDLKFGAVAKTLAKGLDGKNNDIVQEQVQLFVDAFNSYGVAQEFSAYWDCF